MLDNYRTERGIETLPCGSKRSKQTQFPGIEPTTAFLDHEVDFKWTARLATMVTELIPKEIADNKERYKINEAAWDRLQIAPVAEEKWSWKPPAPKSQRRRRLRFYVWCLGSRVTMESLLSRGGNCLSPRAVPSRETRRARSLEERERSYSVFT